VCVLPRADRRRHVRLLVVCLAAPGHPCRSHLAALERRIRHVGSDRMSTVLGATPAPDIAVTRCACGHAEFEHDAIARRYCAATSTAGLSRGCICRVRLVGGTDDCVHDRPRRRPSR